MFIIKILGGIYSTNLALLSATPKMFFFDVFRAQRTLFSKELKCLFCYVSFS